MTRPPTLATAALLSLTACQSVTDVHAQTTTSRLEPLPPNYRELIARDIRALEHFSWGVQSPEITNPGPGIVGYLLGREAITVCVQYKHPDRFRLTTIRTIRVYYLEDGKLVGRAADKSMLRLQCAPPRRLEPFMEIAPVGHSAVVRRKIPLDPANPKGPFRVEEKVYRAPPKQ